MSTFDEREKGFEAKFEHDEEVRFKVAARRNKLVGMWVAEQLGLTGTAAEEYATSLVFQQRGEAAFVKKIIADCAAKGVPMTERRLRRQMAEAALQARKDIAARTS
jgi:hypothetical protein